MLHVCLVYRLFAEGLLKKDLDWMEDSLMKLGLCVVKLVHYLYCMDRHSFLVEILRLAPTFFFLCWLTNKLT